MRRLILAGVFLVCGTTVIEAQDSTVIQRDVITLSKTDSLPIDSALIDSILRIIDQRTKWRFGVGIGSASLHAGEMSFVTPLTLSVLLEHNREWYITAVGGWIPRGPRNASSLSLPDSSHRTESLLSVSASWFPVSLVRVVSDSPTDNTDLNHLKLGFALGVHGAWETIRALDEYLERAYGLSLGLRLQLPLHRVMPGLDAVLGLDGQFSNLSRWPTLFPDESSWQSGWAPSISLNYVFGQRRPRHAQQ